jgi:hypothetical protein
VSIVQPGPQIGRELVIEIERHGYTNWRSRRGLLLRSVPFPPQKRGRAKPLDRLFCLLKTDRPEFNFVDLTGQYSEVALRNQLAPEKLLKLSLSERFPGLARIARKARDLTR